MNSITQVLVHTFLLALAFGTQIFSPVVSTRLTGVGFFKLTNSIVLISLVFAMGADFFMSPGLDSKDILCYSLLIFSNVLTLAFHRDEKTWIMWGLYVLQICTFTYFIFHLFLPTPAWISFFFMSAMLLGISNFAMLLGHYYLVVPKLSEEPLIYCLWIFWALIFIRITTSVTLVLTGAAPFLEEGTVLGDGYMYNWLFISMRYLWGYGAPLILSFFTFRLCKLRSLQSATGVLYIIEFFVIVGELVSLYLMAKHGLSL